MTGTSEYLKMVISPGLWTHPHACFTHIQVVGDGLISHGIIVEIILGSWITLWVVPQECLQYALLLHRLADRLAFSQNDSAENRVNEKNELHFAALKQVLQ